MHTVETLIAIALDLTAALSTKDRYRRLLTALARVIPYDAAALLRVDGQRLIPVAARGLTPDALGRHYDRIAHPRLDTICESDEPVRFTPDDPLPDPFDGLLAADGDCSSRIHACLGCPLHVEGRLIGVLTADALDPQAFDHLDQRFLKAVGALAGAQMQIAALLETLERTAERQGLIASQLMQDITAQRGNQILGGSPLMAHLRREIELVARSDFTVLVQGETGVGKELVVRAIHAASARRDGPLLYLNCAALPENLAESELFGHTQGAFTGANRERAGKFELADGGTLFLDEIGELPAAIQAKLLRAIQEGELQRIGSDKMIHVDVRLLAATNRDLENEVRKGRFRADLFHRLNVYPIRVPALKVRKEDIPLLAGFFCERTQRRLGLGPVRLMPEAVDLLVRYDWPGNVRELENIISRAVLKASPERSATDGRVVIAPLHLGHDLAEPSRATDADRNAPAPDVPNEIPLREATKRFQVRLIQRALAAHEANWSAAARSLGMNRSNLHNLATRLGIRQKTGRR
jgi:anaerobic nitric oxide reductase transcription regulator